MNSRSRLRTGGAFASDGDRGRGLLLRMSQRIILEVDISNM